MRIVLAASEAAPFAKTGGLADVAGALPVALRRLGHEVCVFMPYYRQAAAASPHPELAARLFVPLGSAQPECLVLRDRLPESDVPVYFLARDEFFSRPGIYGPPGGDYWDNLERYAFFCRAVCEAVRELDLRPDVFHLNDWQTALAAAYLRFTYGGDRKLNSAATVLTIHNLAYQGRFPPWKMPATGLDPSHFNWKEFEFYGAINLLKGGLVHADALNTVSRSYAQEIQTAEGGYGLDGVLAERRGDLFGIVNGIDYSVWDPAVDHRLPARYGPKRLAGKAACRRALQEKVGLYADADRPILGMVSRLAEQKGLDILADALYGIMEMPVQFVLLGDGEERFRRAFADLAARFPGRLAVRLGYDDALAHLIEAGSDIYLMPSRYEPCGLNQLISLRYGTVPVVRETGGLADTIADSVNGFSFREYSATALLVAVRRALAVHAERAAWRRLMLRGMAEDWSWDHSAREYVRLYALARSRRGLPPLHREEALAPAPVRRRVAARKKSGRSDRSGRKTKTARRRK